MLNIALNTFKEIIRNKYLYMIIFFSFVFIVFSILLWKLTIWQNSKIIVDFWLAMIEIFWLLWVLFVWSQLLFKEIEGKTIFLILSKPIKRYEFLLWKILGFSFTIFLIILAESVLFLWVLFYQWIQVDNLIIWSIINTFLKLEITLAIVFFLSTFMSNMLTIAVTLMIYILAHGYSIILDLVYNSENSILINITKFWWLLFPPFEALNTKDVIWTFSNFSLWFLLSNGFYGIIYFAILVFFSILIFSRKRFES
jgi:ABC-type transport system involved in multi-copper enzyme maturation permease subunit